MEREIFSFALLLKIICYINSNLYDWIHAGVLCADVTVTSVFSHVVVGSVVSGFIALTD